MNLADRFIDGEQQLLARPALHNFDHAVPTSMPFTSRSAPDSQRRQMSPSRTRRKSPTRSAVKSRPGTTFRTWKSLSFAPATPLRFLDPKQKDTLVRDECVVAPPYLQPPMIGDRRSSVRITAGSGNGYSHFAVAALKAGNASFGEDLAARGVSLCAAEWDACSLINAVPAIFRLLPHCRSS